MSTARLFLCERLAAVSAMIEEIEGNYVAGKKIDTDAYLAMVNTAVRLSNTLGLNRRAKSVPDLGEYINGRRSRVVEHDDAEDDDD